MTRTQANLSPREQLEQKYKAARSNLLLTIILTVVNVVMLLTGSESMLLFSISVPFYAVVFGYFMEGTTMLITGCVIAAIMLAAYLLCWIFSKKRAGWLIAAMVLFIIDTVVMGLMYLLLEEASGIMDVLIHAWVLYYLIVGVISASKLKKMPPEETAVTAEVTGEEQAAGEMAPNSTPIRRAEEDVKHRVLLEETYGGRQIVYRRVKRVNELVISGYVYDEYEALMETSHCLSARIDGHTIEMGYDALGFSYFKVDGQLIKKKVRLA